MKLPLLFACLSLLCITNSSTIIGCGACLNVETTACLKRREAVMNCCGLALFGTIGAKYAALASENAQNSCITAARNEWLPLGNDIHQSASSGAVAWITTALCVLECIPFLCTCNPYLTEQRYTTIKQKICCPMVSRARPHEPMLQESDDE